MTYLKRMAACGLFLRKEKPLEAIAFIRKGGLFIVKRIATNCGDVMHTHVNDIPNYVCGAVARVSFDNTWYDV